MWGGLSGGAVAPLRLGLRPRHLSPTKWGRGTQGGPNVKALEADLERFGITPRLEKR